MLFQVYSRKSRLSPRIQGKLIELFVAVSTARAAAEVTGGQVITAIRFFMGLRRLISSKLPSYELNGDVEADESYFGGRSKGKRGRGAAGKVVVFGQLKSGGKVYTAIILHARTATLLPIIEEKEKPDSIVYTDTFKANNTFDVSDLRHMRINHSELFTDKANHINSIENFWNQAKRHLRRLNGIKKKSFY